MTMLSNRGENFCLATSSVRHRARAFQETPGYEYVQARNFIADPTNCPDSGCVISTPQRYNRPRSSCNFINNESTFFKAVEILSLRRNRFLCSKDIHYPSFITTFHPPCLLCFTFFAQFRFAILMDWKCNCFDLYALSVRCLFN